MKKRYAFVGIIIFVVGLIYGTTCNFILQEGGPSIVIAIIQGTFIGILSTTIFDIVRLSFVYLFYKSSLDKFEKFLILFLKISIELIFACYIIDNITDHGKVALPPYYSQLATFTIIYSIIIVDIGHYCGIISRRNMQK